MIKTVATYKTLQDSSLILDTSRLECDICGSADIVDTTGGYVCRECGVVLEVQKLQYDRPYNEDIIQHARGLGKTRLGTNRERGTSPLSGKYHRLNRHNLITPNGKELIEEAKHEISTIFSRLDLDDYRSIKQMVLSKFNVIRPHFRPGLKYRNTNKLVTIISYFCLKLRNVAINFQDIIEASTITKKEFNDFCIQVRRYIPDYLERNRQEYILNRVLEITEHFNLGMSFYHLAGKILENLWNTIKNTTDNVVAGLISSISLLCNKIEQVSVSAICTRLGIRMSTVQAQVKKKIFRKFKVDGFVSLIKSSDLLVQIIEKLGLIDTPQMGTEMEHEEVPQELLESEESVELIFGNVAEVFNSHNNRNYYYFAVKGVNNTPLIISIDINEFPLTNDSEFCSEVTSNNLLDCRIFKYYNTKGPPSPCES